jgi:hypothetical protein
VYIELNLVFELGQNFLNLKKCARIEITRFKNGEKLAQTCSQRTSRKKKKKKKNQGIQGSVEKDEWHNTG